MKFYALFAAAVLGSALALSSCAKKETVNDLGLSEDVLHKIEHLGFSSENAFATEGGYIVEGDIFLTDHDLNGPNPDYFHNLIVGESEQYRTFNLVTGLPRVIEVSISGNNIPQRLIDGTIAAVDRYNAENLGLTFNYIGTSGGGDINIRLVRGGGYIASAGFPTNNGNPYGEIKYNKTYAGNNYSLGFVTTVVAHEMGHCIGFRHTDYMNRAYSCGSGGNEGSGTVGAVHIPGTPTGPDANSWMLACLSATTNRPFNNNDKTALDYLY